MEDMGNYGYTLFRTIPKLIEFERFSKVASKKSDAPRVFKAIQNIKKTILLTQNRLLSQTSKSMLSSKKRVVLNNLFTYLMKLNLFFSLNTQKSVLPFYIFYLTNTLLSEQIFYQKHLPMRSI